MVLLYVIPYPVVDGTIAPDLHQNYDDFGYAPDLTPLGRIESGLEYLQEIDGGSMVTIELAK